MCTLNSPFQHIAFVTRHAAREGKSKLARRNSVAYTLRSNLLTHEVATVASCLTRLRSLTRLEYHHASALIRVFSFLIGTGYHADNRGDFLTGIVEGLLVCCVATSAYEELYLVSPPKGLIIVSPQNLAPDTWVF